MRGALTSELWDTCVQNWYSSVTLRFIAVPLKFQVILKKKNIYWSLSVYSTFGNEFPNVAAQFFFGKTNRYATQDGHISGLRINRQSQLHLKAWGLWPHTTGSETQHFLSEGCHVICVHYYQLWRGVARHMKNHLLMNRNKPTERNVKLQSL